MRSPRIRRRSGSDCVATTWPTQMHPILRRVYALRGVRAAQEVEHRLAAMQAPAALGGIEAACARLATALAQDQRIVIVGDFDCDGATGTAVAVRGLRALGARHVEFRVPHRFRHGYGLSAALVAELDNPAPDLIITVDNGVASISGVAAARARGIGVIVTDHHLPGSELPDADAIVNPNLPGDAFPSKALAGVGVMFYLLLALRASLRRDGWFARRGIVEPDLASLLDLVAVGTVADLVPLDFNNRILVSAGIRRMRQGQACAGVAALLTASGRDATRVVASDLGFSVGPRINAAGRLEDMALGIECLLSDDPEHARMLAERLSGINAERRALQTDMVESGEALVARYLDTHGDAALPVGVVLYEPDWHAGVVGLLASKLKDRLHRPVIACAPAGEGDAVRASARSIPGFHIRDALAEVDARHPGLIERFGGHAMAAGLSLRAGDIGAFAAAFDAVARERIDDAQLQAVLDTDGELERDDFCLDLAQQLRSAGPWGQGFPEPLFDNLFELDSWRVIGASGTHVRLHLRLPGTGSVFEAIQFNGHTGSAPPTHLRAVYELDVNDWNGRERLQLLVRHIEAADVDAAR